MARVLQLGPVSLSNGLWQGSYNSAQLAYPMALACGPATYFCPLEQHFIKTKIGSTRDTRVNMIFNNSLNYV